jgi:predicted glycosyltransferase
MWQELGVYDALENLYDGIAVYGSRELYDVAKAYHIPAAVIPKLHYCGYVVREAGNVDEAAIRRQYELPSDGKLLVATVGGGSDGFPVLAAAQATVQCLQREHPNLNAILVTGPLMPKGQQEVLQARATSRCRVIPHADNFQLMAAADAIVSMGGYNSVCEALSLGRPLVIVPRATHKIEQQIRAETLAARGLARWVHPKDLSGDALAEGIEWALSCDRNSHRRLVRSIIPSFDGASRLTDYLAQWLGNEDFRARPRLESSPLLEGPA